MNISLYQAAAALNANSRWQDAIAENLASSSIPGYKRQDYSFSAVQAGLMQGVAASGAGSAPHFSLPEGRGRINFAPGQLKPTGVDTDLAIEGPGFFEVQLPNGDTAYTRDGEFQLNAQGQLVTKQGYAVIGDSGTIQLDRNSRGSLNISSEGQISQGNQVRGKLKVVTFGDPQLLAHVGGGYFQPRDQAVQPTDLPEATVKQRFLEAANTSPVTEMVNLLAAMRYYETNQRLVQLNDERMSTAIRDLAGAS